MSAERRCSYPQVPFRPTKWYSCGNPPFVPEYTENVAGTGGDWDRVRLSWQTHASGPTLIHRPLHPGPCASANSGIGIPFARTPLRAAEPEGFSCTGTSSWAATAEIALGEIGTSPGAIQGGISCACDSVAIAMVIVAQVIESGIRTVQGRGRFGGFRCQDDTS